MASIYALKPAFQNLLRPVCKALVSVGITANQVTLAALAMSIAMGAYIAGFPTERWPLLLVPIVLFLRMALNAIDGMIAREHDMQTPLGAVLNELGDVVSDTALYLPLALVPQFDAAWIVAVVLLAIFTELAGVVAVQIGAGRRYDGPMGKSDRAFIFGAICLFLGLGLPIQGRWVTAVLMFVAALSVWTVLNRVQKALAEQKVRVAENAGLSRNAAKRERRKL